MSIASEISRISGNVADAYTAANAKGATMPVTQNSDNLATTISTIQTGTTPTGTKSITANGVYDVTDFASADVQVPTAAPAYYIEKTKDANGVAQNGSYLMDLSTFTDVGNYVFAYAYYGSTGITGAIDFGSLTNVTGNFGCSNMFNRCTGITSVDLSSLTTVSGSQGCSNMFYGCTGLTGAIDFGSLTNVDGSFGCNSMFYGCTGITSVDLSSLTSVTNGQDGCSNMFYNCTGITSVDLSSLTIVGSYSGCGNMFYGCTGLTSVDLSLLTIVSGNNGCQNMFNGCTNLASVNLSHLAKLGTNNNIGQMFRNCTSLTELRFSGLPYTATNINSAFSNTLQGVTGCTVHFPSDWQTAMASYSNITNGLGGTNTTVLFDLPAVTTLDLSYITEFSIYNALQSFGSNNYFANITSVDLSSLTTISGTSACYQMFKDCPNITSIDLGSLETISGRQGCNYMFSGCTGLTSIDLSSLTTINGEFGCAYMFSGCTGITSVDLSSLETINGTSPCQYMFSNCTSLTTLSFPALKTVVDSNVFGYMLQGVTGCTVHFPSNLSSYNFNCGGTNTTVLYDLPSTGA